MWIEINGRRTDVEDMPEARSILKRMFPEATFLQPIQVGRQRITHVRSVSKTDTTEFDLMPVAVIVEESTPVDEGSEA